MGTKDEAVADWRGPSRSVGLYDIGAIEQAGGAVVSVERTGGFWSDRGGFAYLPDGPPLVGLPGVRGLQDLRHLGGSWYVWTAEW